MAEIKDSGIFCCWQQIANQGNHSLMFTKLVTDKTNVKEAQDRARKEGANVNKAYVMCLSC